MFTVRGIWRYGIVSCFAIACYTVENACVAWPVRLVMCVGCLDMEQKNGATALPSCAAAIQRPLSDLRLWLPEVWKSIIIYGVLSDLLRLCTFEAPPWPDICST